MKYLAAAVSKVGLIGATAQTGPGLVDPSNHFQGPCSQLKVAFELKLSKLEGKAFFFICQIHKEIFINPKFAAHCRKPGLFAWS